MLEKEKAVVVIAIANHKGGVGKTTTTAELAYLFATEGKKRICLIDADAQINLTQRMQVRTDGRIDIQGAVLSRCLDADVGIDTFVVPTQYAGIDMIPGSLHLESDQFSAAVQKARMEEGINPWEEVVNDIKALGRYDVILVDTHPSIGTDTLLPMQACDLVLVPLEPVEDAVAGLFQVYQNIRKSRRRANPDIRFLGAYFNRVKLNTSSAKDYIPDARRVLPEEIKRMNHGEPEGVIFNTTVRDSEDARKASNFHCAITERFANKKIAQDFRDLYHEIVRTLEHEK